MTAAKAVYYLFLAAILGLGVMLITATAVNASTLPNGKWPAIDQLASRVAGFPIDVRCQALGETTFFGVDSETFGLNGAAGLTIFWNDGSRGPVILSSRTCAGVLLALTDPKATLCSSAPFGYCHISESWLQGDGLFVLIHEIGHMVLGRNEGAADCYALARVAAVARSLGYPASTADYFAGVGLTHHQQSIAAYHDGCP
jgi:hypothetical protein